MSPVPTPPSPPAPRLTPATAVALAADLAALPFTTAAVEGLLGPVATLALDREHAEAAAQAAALIAIADPGRPVHVGVLLGNTPDMLTAMAAAGLAAALPNVYATAGIHPHNAGTYTAADLEALAGLCGSPGIVALGEVGLLGFMHVQLVRDRGRQGDQPRHLVLGE